MSDESTPEVVETAAPVEASAAESFDLSSLDDVMAAMAEPAEAEEPQEVVEEAPSEPQEPVQEAASAPQVPTAPVAPPQEDQRILDRLAQKEREMVARLQREREELAAERAAVEAERARIREFEEFERRLAEEDVVGALESRGWHLDELARAAVQGRGAAPLRRIENEVKKQQEIFQRELQALKQEREVERQRALQAAADAEIRRELQTRSPLLSSAGEVGRNALMAVAQAYHQAGQPVPSYETLVPEAERSLAQLIESVLSVEANRARFLPQSASPEKQVKPSPTMSGNVASQASRRTARPNVDDLPMEDAIDELWRSGDLFT